MEELIALLKMRERIYKILSYSFYKEADADYLADLRSCLPVFETAGKEDGIADLIEGVEIMTDFFATDIDDKGIEELACAFARIFLVMNVKGGVQGVSPSESVYLSPDKIVMQVQRDEVMVAYASEGIAKDKNLFGEPEDHISAEMFFLAQMSAKTLEAVKNGDEKMTEAKLQAQRSFLENHLMKWINPLCNDLFRLAGNEFYKGIAKISGGFVKWDYDKISCILKDA